MLHMYRWELVGTLYNAVALVYGLLLGPSFLHHHSLLNRIHDGTDMLEFWITAPGPARHAQIQRSRLPHLSLHAGFEVWHHIHIPPISSGADIVRKTTVTDRMCNRNIQALEIRWLGREGHRRLGMGVRLLREGRGRGKGRDSRGWGISDEGVVGMGDGGG